MKVLFWNLGYAREFDGSSARFITHGHRVPSHPHTFQHRTLTQMAELVQAEAPDVFLCAEVSSGAFHNRSFDQYEYLKTTLNPENSEFFVKYGQERLAALPFHKGNGNAAYTFVPSTITPLHLSRGSKTLVTKVEIGPVTCFGVHLSLLPTVRRTQLEELAQIVKQCEGDVVVGGDFNLFRGLRELLPFAKQTGLALALPLKPTFPSHRPRYLLDVFLYRFSTPRTVTASVLQSRLSDHLPVLFEWY